MVAIAADYRVSSRHGVKAVDCVADAKSAVRWLRHHAARLGVDPDRIVAGGGSAGGHLAACTAVIKQFDEAGEDTSISSVPNATALFNPAVILAGVEGKSLLSPDKAKELNERMGVASEQLSPFHQLEGTAPPCIIFHGKADKTVPYETVELYTQKMKDLGNRCELKGYADAGHGFFNFNRDGDFYEGTIAELDKFLVSLGYLAAIEPTTGSVEKE